MEIKISLARLVQLKDRLNNEINEVRNEVGLGAFIEKTADIETNHISVEQFEENLKKLKRLQSYLYLIVGEITRTNQETLINYRGQEMNLQTALIKAKFDRAYGEKLESIGRRKKVEVSSNGNFTRTGDRIVIERLLDPKETLEAGKQAKIFADHLSREIELAGVETIVELNTELYPKFKGIEEYL